MRHKQTIIKVTHEFVDDPGSVRRAYETWAVLLARALNLAEPDQITATGPSRRRSRKRA